MWKVAAVVLLVLALSACAHRQPKARCTGSLERINVSPPKSTTDPGPHPHAPPNEESKDEGSEP